MPESIDEVIQAIWHELEGAARDPRHGWRLPVLATVDSRGLPQARTVVLRAADPGARQLVIYSDRRSPKVEQINREPNVVLVFWCRNLGWQLRLSAAAAADNDSAETAVVWQQLKNSPAAGDYLRPAAPGAVHEPQHAGAPTGPGYFCRLIIQVEQMDWLDLQTEGHRRLRWRAGQGEWLVP